jgi:crotonobetainyl-CoA:carnitine CoA-transferase CaiB-like acyl-CoA transferase
MSENYVKDIFKDITVVELSSVLAGPSAGMFFAELGAEVIKIEPPQGDVTRTWRLKNEDSNKKDSAYYNSINYGKKSLFLDLRSDEAIEQIHDLIKNADIITANFKQGSAEKYRLDYQSLIDINPQLIYAQLYGFNANSKRLAYDVVMQAETGFLSMTGTDQNEICKIPVALIDLIAGHHMKEAILIALLKKERFKKGSYIELSLLGSGLSSLANQASNYLNEAFIPKPMGTLHPNIAPYGEICETADQEKLILAIGSDLHFERLLKVLDLNSYLNQFSDNQKRLELRTELHSILRRSFAKFKFDEICQLLILNSVPFGHIKNLAQAMSLASEEGLILSDSSSKSRTISMLPFKIY